MVLVVFLVVVVFVVFLGFFVVGLALVGQFFHQSAKFLILLIAVEVRAFAHCFNELAMGLVSGKFTKFNIIVSLAPGSVS